MSIDSSRRSPYDEDRYDPTCDRNHENVLAFLRTRVGGIDAWYTHGSAAIRMDVPL